jgi:ADP-ribose pyrophosphatase YjhB (NUDIX family)
MTRSGVILINDQKIALIERVRDSKHYYVFPGGQVEKGEMLEDAAIREAMEELGLEVQIEKLAAIIHFENEIQYYYLVKSLSGKFGSGTGPEMVGNYPPENGTYMVVWLPIKNMKKFTILPPPLCKLVIKYKKDRWPDLPFALNEESN